MKLYFHIGQKKTGTSSIQSFLNFNRELLAQKHKILYPNFNISDLGKGLLHNHAVFYQNIFKSNLPERVAKFKECLSYANDHGIEKIVLSAENFEFQWLPKALSEITEKLKIDASIILYLRRQDHYLQAAWKQWGHKTQNVSTIHEYEKGFDMDWHKTILPWLNYFTPENFIVRPYEKYSIGEDVVPDFMKILGIDDLHGFVEPPDNNLNKNHGLNNDVMEILHLCKNMAKGIHNHSLIDFIYNTLPDHYKKQPMTGYSFLSPTESLNIIKKYWVKYKSWGLA